MGEIDGQSYEANLAETLDYVLKGADDAARERLGIRRKEPGGDVVGKRCGVSQNIGPDARRVGLATSTRTTPGVWHRIALAATKNTVCR
jgi:hypothetical protein